MFVEVGVGALGSLIADTIMAGAGGTRRRLRRDPEHQALSVVVAQAAAKAFSAARLIGLQATDEWYDDVAEQWVPAFTRDVIAQLLAVIGTPSDDNKRAFEQLVRSALQGGLFTPFQVSE